MKNKHICICPICGGDSLAFILRGGFYICGDCYKEVIPLRTPQEKE